MDEDPAGQSPGTYIYGGAYGKADNLSAIASYYQRCALSKASS